MSVNNYEVITQKQQLIFDQQTGNLTGLKNPNAHGADLDLGGSGGSDLVGFIQDGTGAVERTAQDKMRDVVSVKDFGAVGDGVTDDSAAIQAAHNTGSCVLYPKGSYKSTSTITIPPGGSAVGESESASQVMFYGCDGFSVSSYSQIENLGLLSLSSVGAYDPRTKTAIKALGNSGDYKTGISFKSLFLRGWNYCINFEYVWSSLINNIETVNSNYGVRIFGLTVNNSISDCNLTVNSGVASIVFVADGSTTGEGLCITNSRLTSGQYGIQGSDFLALTLSNCIIDLISNKGISVANPIKMEVSNCWIYAGNVGIDFPAQGLSSNLGASISNCQISTNGVGSVGVRSDVNNIGVSVIGGSIACPSTGYCGYGLSDQFAWIGVNLINPGSNPSVYFEYGTGNVFQGCTGNNTVEFLNGAPPRNGAPIPQYNKSLTYSSSMTPDCNYGCNFVIGVTNSLAFTINDPTNVPYSTQQTEITFAIFNLSGGAMGLITWGSKFKLAGAFTNPSNNTIRTISFKWIGGDRWIETSRSSADLPL